MSFWWTLQGLLIAGAALDFALPWAGAQGAVLRSRGLLGLALALPLVSLTEETPVTWAPTAEVWSTRGESADAPSVSVAPISAQEMKVPTSVSALPWLATLPGGIWGVGSLVSVLWRIRRAERWRRVGRVQVMVSGDSQVPWSFAVFGSAYVVLDVETFADPALRAIAISHELQHHRAGDTAWAWCLWAVGALSAINPAWWFWRARIVESEEVACDAAVIRGGVAPREYSLALVSVGARSPQLRALMSGFSSPVWKSQLGRRVDMILNSKSSSARWTLVAAFAGIAGVAWAGDGLVVDHRVDEAQVRAAVDGAGSASFPLVVNDAVVAQLNRFVATPKGRRFALRSLSDREAHREFIEGEIRKAGLPIELAAVPFVESGYRNLTGAELYPDIPPAKRGAGLWMFIPSTARMYGLRVNAKEDLRLDIPRETDAAIRLLSSNYAQYGDWGLALAAYNQGPQAVDEAIRTQGTRDIWKLMESGALNSYYAQVMAAAILLEDPSLIE